MTTTIVYGDASDGQIMSSGSTYAIARAGTGTLTVDSQNNLTPGQYGPSWAVYESFLRFDTSVLGIDQTVSGVQFVLTVNTDNTSTNYTNETRLFDWTPGGLTSADYVPGADLASYPLMTTFTSGSLNTPGTAITQTEVALANNINKTGFTSLFMSSSRTRLNTTPGSQEYITYRSADYSGTTSDPKITITHSTSAAPSAGMPIMRTFKRNHAG